MEMRCRSCVFRDGIGKLPRIMKLARFTVPIGIGLFCAGVAMFVSAKPGAAKDLGIDFSQARKVAPSFSLKDVKGAPASIAGKGRQKPQFVLFILDGCPCSIDAQPIFNNFAKHWEGKVDFIGVINDDPQKGRAWVSDYRPIFPVVPDPDKKIIHAYRARQSVYCALISREGEIVEMWPGYSVDMMEEMNSKMAKEVGEKVRPFDAQYVPKERSSGCYF